ncbi:MAG: prenyltransferase/squalene oxidase repeat-containing protein, partial [Planctomycetota bacterium]
AWIRAQQQDDGSFFAGPMFRLGATELCAIALLDAGAEADDPAVSKAITYIRQFVQEDGGIYNPSEGLGNYCTSLGLMALTRAGEPKDSELVQNAQQYLLGLQNTDEDSINYGGIGYGSRGTGNEDLNNTQHAVQALRETGMSADHPAMQRALKFIQRCQNLSSHNDLEWASNTGSGVYSPDSSKAGGSYHGGHNGQKPEVKHEPAKATGLKGYGTMTYNLITAYIYLQLEPGDPRLDAAMEWVKQNYQFERNPGLPDERARQGLFYYYTTMAKTWTMAGKDTIELPDGTVVDWRGDLFKAIAARAVPVGEDQVFWINDMDRWAEGIPNLTTAYMLTTLARIEDSLTAE